MLFDFLTMMDNYEDRAVARYEDEAKGLAVDTCAVTDSGQPFETAVAHPAYNDHKWIIVELYDSKEAANAGHNEWVRKMVAETLPASLTDVSTANIAMLEKALGSDLGEPHLRDI